MDADGLIKLYRSGVLPHVVRVFPCTISRAVYDEVVTKGKARLHQDAEAIEGIIAGAVTVAAPQEHRRQEPGLGAGELATLDLFNQEQDALVVSDDRRFLTLLASQKVPFLTPTDVLVVLAGCDVLTRAESLEALERLRPAIRKAAYWEARHDLEAGGKTREK